jgi:transglutaminase-like putative cysteine protease
MVITTLHETLFQYDRSIRGTFTEARLWPMSDEGQTCHSFSLTVDPMRTMAESTDYFGNKVLNFNILTPHDCVVLTGHSVVETHRKPFERKPDLPEFEIQKARLDFLQFDGPVEDVPQVLDMASDLGLFDAARSEPDDVFAAVQSLNAAIFNTFTFAPQTTDVHTHISEVFSTKQGVCQDFSHIFLAVCRAAGLPARYVSGYLVTRRSRSAEGSPASHAWAEVLIPGYGWCAFDPTNNLLANDYYIKLAVGRDYRDVPPTRGVYNGSGIRSRLQVRVHTLVHEDPVSGLLESSDRDGQRENMRHTNAPRELVG